MANLWSSVKNVEVLIEIWANEKVQAMLDSNHRNKDVYNMICDELNRRVPDHDKPSGGWSLEQCRNKIKSLKKTYYQAKKMHKQSGQGRSSFR